jgi:hypothetical protein
MEKYLIVIKKNLEVIYGLDNFGITLVQMRQRIGIQKVHKATRLKPPQPPFYFFLCKLCFSTRIAIHHLLRLQPAVVKPYNYSEGLAKHQSLSARIATDLQFGDRAISLAVPGVEQSQPAIAGNLRLLLGS